MPPFEGEGGKKPKRKRKPTTLAGVYFSQAIELEQNHMLSTGEGQANRTTTDNTGNQYEDLQQQQTNCDQLDQEFDYNPQHSTSHHFNFTDHENSSSNIRVQQLHQHFQAEHVKKKRLLEEKHWEEVYDSMLYDSMFSSFKQCAVKTADWGDEDKWRQDWKGRCPCLDKQSRPLVLVNILKHRPSFPEVLSPSVSSDYTTSFGKIVLSPSPPLKRQLTSI
ncbi:hypothetical protein PGT21_031783 [Puccinia graminis f. sp. tritici]|uniref:CxC1-like cysteine cluster associated with KDZ transposases domain-containing protein n=1 Tax=Puccinia graminis f. sp. tritici TaxID=56615 RepID=A0A5B0N9X3_PUCGR|nr:hypothetical protein PGT21_031783 [Puccinia graminis f. sp. tritici]KAA1099179.1 hypothetical protein PGTUg99_015179 [Puccinia graminis f. sp. tritici]